MSELKRVFSWRYWVSIPISVIISAPLTLIWLYIVSRIVFWLGIFSKATINNSLAFAGLNVWVLIMITIGSKIENWLNKYQFVKKK